MKKPTSRIEAIFKEKRIKEVVAGVTSVLMCMTVFVTVFLLMSPALTVGGDETALCGLVRHTHADGCYANGVLVCRTPEHEHDMACFSPALELYHYSCGYDYEHQHTQECYVNGVLICSMTEHTHGETCHKIETPLKARFTALKLAAANAPDLSAFPVSGTCQNGALTWVIDAAGGLTLSKTPGSTLSVVNIPPNAINRGWQDYIANITKVTVEPGVGISANTGKYLFQNYSSCKEFNLSNLKLDTDSGINKANDLSNMFYRCKSAEKIDISGWDTQYVTYMAMMFYDCDALKELNMSGFDTSSVTKMSKMFYNCQVLEELEFPETFDTSNVTDMNGMFDGCKALQELDVSGFDTSNVTNMSNMFDGCKALQELDLSGFDTSNVTTMSGMFQDCITLEKLTFSEDFDTSNVTDMSNMFNSCQSLEELDVSGFDTAKVTDMYYMFGDCESLTELDVTNFVTSSATDMSGMFFFCASLEELDVSGFDTSNVTEMNSMFAFCETVEKLDVSGFDTSNVTDMNSMFSGDLALKKLDVSGFDTSNVTDMNSMFAFCTAVEKLDVSGFDTSNVTDMNAMFLFCKALEKVDVSGFDTSNVTDMNSMFSECSSLTEIDVSGFDTSNVTDMGSMFSGCEVVEELEFSEDFDTSKVTNMSGMFQSCYALTELDVTGFNTSKVKNMGAMFDGCSGLTELDVTNFDTGAVTDMGKGQSYLGGMFGNCSSLTSLDLSNFDTSKVTTMSSMFKGCYSLEEIDVSDFDTSSLTNMEQMFYGCGSLTELDLSAWTMTGSENMNGMFVKMGGALENGSKIILPGTFKLNSAAKKTPFVYTTYAGKSEIDYYIKLNSDGSLDSSVKDSSGIASYQATSDADTVYVPYYAVAFNANGGIFADGSETNEIYYRAGKYWSLDDAPEVSRNSATLVGWDSTADLPSTRINGNEWRLASRFGQYAGLHDAPAITLYAEWSAGTVTVDTSAIAVAQAIATGDETMPQKTFTYKLNCTEPYGPASVTGTAVSSGAGCYNVDFGDLEFNYPGSYHLEIMPVDSSACGWVINRVPKNVTVTVTKDSTSGALAVSSITPAVFTNVYSGGKDTASIGDSDKPDASQKNYTMQEEKDTLLKSSEWTDKSGGEGEIRLIYNNNSADKEIRAVYLMCTCLAHDFTVNIAKSNIKFLCENFDYVDVITLEDQMNAGGFAQHCASFTSYSTDAEVAAFLDSIKFLEGNHAGVMYTIDIMTDYLSHFEPTAVFVSFDGVRGFGVDANPYAFTDSIYLDLFGTGYLTDSISYTEAQKNTIKRLAEYQRNGVYYLMTADQDDYSVTDKTYTIIKPFSAVANSQAGYPAAYRNLLEHFFAVVAPAVYVDAPDDVEDMIDSLMSGSTPIVWETMLASFSETYSDRVYSYDESFEDIGVEVPTGRKFVLHDTIDKAFNIQSTAILDGIKVGFYGVDNSGKVTWTALNSAYYTVTAAEDNSGNTELSVAVTVTNLSEPLVVRIPVKTELEQYKTADGGFRATNIDDAYVDVTVHFENSKTHLTSDSTATTTSTSTPKLFKKVSIIDFYIDKTDEEGTPLQGVGFTLYALDSANAPANAETFVYNNKTYYKVAAGETGADGYVKFENVKTGAVYLFRETSFLQGYLPLSGCQEFYFVEAGDGDESAYHDEYDAEEGDNYFLSADALVEGVIYNPDENNVFCVINYPYAGEELPATGGRGAAAFIAFGAVCMTLAGAIFLFKKKCFANAG